MVDNCAYVNILLFTLCDSYKNILKLAPYGEHSVCVCVGIYIYIYIWHKKYWYILWTTLKLIHVVFKFMPQHRFYVM